MKKWLLFLFFFTQLSFGTEVNFIAIDAQNDHVVMSIGPSIEKRCSPCSTYKIVLSLIGYDVGILKNEQEPIWHYDGCQVPSEAHKASQSPKSWMTLSVVWYSRQLARRIGYESLRKYVSLFSYGNQDVAGEFGKKDGFETAHLVSTLKISPQEQAFFLQKLVHDQVKVSPYAVRVTKSLLHNQTFDSGWKLFGKTGSGLEKDGKSTLSWYVGWIEKNGRAYVFAFLMKDEDRFPTKAQRQEYVKRFFCQVGIDIDSN